MAGDMAKKRKKNILIKNYLKKYFNKKLFYLPWPATRPWQKKKKKIILIKNIINKKIFKKKYFTGHGLQPGHGKKRKKNFNKKYY